MFVNINGVVFLLILMTTTYNVVLPKKTKLVLRYKTPA